MRAFIIIIMMSMSFDDDNHDDCDVFMRFIIAALPSLSSRIRYLTEVSLARRCVKLRIWLLIVAQEK